MHVQHALNKGSAEQSLAGPKFVVLLTRFHTHPYSTAEIDLPVTEFLYPSDSMKHSRCKTTTTRYCLNKGKRKMEFHLDFLLETVSCYNTFVNSFADFYKVSCYVCYWHIILLTLSYKSELVYNNCYINTLWCVGIYVSKCCQTSLLVMKQWF